MSDAHLDERSLVRMSDEEVVAFLRECHTMSLSTLNGDGTIHSAALWYGFLGDRVVFSTRAKSQKAKNLQRNPNLTSLFENGSYSYDRLKGVEIIGTALPLEKLPDRIEAMRSSYDRNVRAYSECDRATVERMERGLFIAAIEPSRIASWDHTKLAPRGQLR